MSAPRARARAHGRLVAPVVALGLGLTLVVPASLVTAPAAVAADAPLTVTGLQTNGRTEPLGIPGADPSLSWRSESSARGVVQSAYEVRVASSEDELSSADVWDSGKVGSDDQTDVVYGGPDLAAATRYVWQVKVWDGAGAASEWSEPATFETGLLDAADWGDAEWIGKSAHGEVDRWTDYTADIDFDIDQLALGVFVRAKDTGNAYMWQISTADGTGVPKFRPHKRVNGVYTLLDNKPITGITSAQLLDGTHRLSVTVDGSTITTLLDGNQIDQRTDASFAKGFVGFRQDFAGDTNESADIKAVKVTSKGGDVLLDTDFSDGNPFNGGTLTAQGLRVADRKDVLWRSPDANKPLLRTEFTTEPGKTIESARVYASAHGVYELELNGEKVGDQFLAPGSTDYRKRIQSQTYDITDQVHEGDNALGAELGDGWWAGKVGMWGPGMFGTSLGLIAHLRIDYTDGTHQVVDSDGSWKSHFGPYAAADNIDGETYDANAEQPGWDQPAFDDTAWNDVAVAGSDTSTLVPQPDEPVRVTGERPALSRVPSPGVDNGYIYDLGQNMVGVARMRISGVAGQTVKFRYAEELRANGEFYVGNLRAAKVTDYYTFKTTGTVEYTPKFTQHGFRYIEISGASTPPEIGDVTGVVWGSDLKATGTLQTSDAMLNQLVSNISWGQRGNFLSIPTDTPARDERLGWTGDINVFAPTASYLRDTRAFLSKWTADLRDSAYDNGNLPGIAPSVPTIDLGSGLGWSDSQITVPYASFHAQGDTAIVRQNYAAMQKFFTFVQNGAGADLIDSARGNWNDWLNLDDNTGVDVLGTAYYAEDARMLSEMAAAIGEDADAAAYAALSEQIRDAFTDKLISDDGTVDGNSQTAYAMALGMDLVTDPALREKVGTKFVAKLKTSDFHLTTGFLGTPWLLPALTSIDRSDLAYTMILKKDYPSWGYEIQHGATTMWERWNSIGPDGSFGDEGMNSFNHYAYGAVGDWMYQNIGAIKALEPGYKTLQVKPAVGGGLTHGSGHYDSVYGAIDTDWKTQGEDLSLTVDVPVNTTADVVLPAANQYAVSEGGHLLADVDGVTDVTATDDLVTVTVGSGHYEFEVTAANARLGSIIESVDAVKAHVGDLAGSGDLESADADHLDGGLADVRDDVSAALLAGLAEESTTDDLQSALDGVQALRGWLATSAVEQSVRADLDGRLGQVEGQLVRALTVSLGIQVALPPVSGSALPGTTVSGTIDVTNSATGPVTGLAAEVSVDGWGTASASLGSLAADRNRVEVSQAVLRDLASEIPAPGHLRGAEARGAGRLRRRPGPHLHRGRAAADAHGHHVRLGNGHVGPDDRDGHRHDGRRRPGGARDPGGAGHQRRQRGRHRARRRDAAGGLEERPVRPGHHPGRRHRHGRGAGRGPAGRRVRSGGDDHRRTAGRGQPGLRRRQPRVRPADAADRRRGRPRRLRQHRLGERTRHPGVRQQRHQHRGRPHPPLRQLGQPWRVVLGDGRRDTEQAVRPAWHRDLRRRTHQEVQRVRRRCPGEDPAGAPRRDGCRHQGLRPAGRRPGRAGQRRQRAGEVRVPHGRQRVLRPVDRGPVGPRGGGGHPGAGRVRDDHLRHRRRRRLVPGRRHRGGRGGRQPGRRSGGRDG